MINFVIVIVGHVSTHGMTSSQMKQETYTWHVTPVLVLDVMIVGIDGWRTSDYVSDLVTAGSSGYLGEPSSTHQRGT
jgi:hypothetical protein